VRPFERFSLLLWGLVLLVALAQVAYLFHFWGIKPIWDLIHRTGHAAGWCGAALMVLSLLFIPRKKKWFRLGSVRLWYRLHVVFGITGPLLIVLHAYGKYYGFGGLTFLCMWAVLVTGIIGHYLYRRLPEEVEVRSAQRLELLERLAEAERAIAASGMHRENLKDELSRAGPLSQLSADSLGSTKIKLPRSELSKDLGRIISLWRAFGDSRKRLRDLTSRVRSQASSERRAAALRERELLELLNLERDTGMLLALNEIFSLLCKVHVPLSWLMWWTASLHLFAWTYY
jgi:hypothetical protein